MNKQLINKYKHEFDHWLNGGSVLINSDLGWCPIATEFTWSCNISVNALFVINDEYVEFRKALAEGKTIQLNEAHKFADSNRGWVDLYCISLGNSINLFPVNYYRIKPDEPKFKVGDFVTPLKREINCSVWQIDNILSCHTLVSGNTMLDPRTIQLWTPVKNEWCWFYDKASNKYSYLAKFNEMWKNKFRSTTDTPWQFCEPFLNSLPSYLKDK